MRGTAGGKTEQSGSESDGGHAAHHGSEQEKRNMSVCESGEMVKILTLCEER